jgi:hypothetical protein
MGCCSTAASITPASRVDHAGKGHVTTRANIWDEDHRLVASSEQLARFANTALPK